MQNSESEIVEAKSKELVLINQCLQGDTKAFKELMNMHFGFVGAVTQKYIWIREDVEEVVQEVFLKVWLNLNTYNVERKFTTWLYRITVNCCFDKLRKQMGKKDFDEFDESSTYTVNMSADSSDKRILSKELLTIIKSLSNQLSPTQRIVFTMIDLDERKIGEAAETLGMSKSAVKANLSYARKQIRTKLVKYI